MGQSLQNRIGTTRPLPLGEALVLAVTVAAGHLGAMCEEVLSAHDITPRQYNVLRILRGAGALGASHGEIGRRLLARTPDVTRLMDQLVARGWAARVKSDADARVVLHRLTNLGSDALFAVTAPLHKRYEALVSCLGTQSTQELVTLCEQVMDAVAADAPHAVHT